MILQSKYDTNCILNKKSKRKNTFLIFMKIIFLGEKALLIYQDGYKNFEQMEVIQIW